MSEKKGHRHQVKTLIQFDYPREMSKPEIDRLLEQIRIEVDEILRRKMRAEIARNNLRLIRL